MCDQSALPALAAGAVLIAAPMLAPALLPTLTGGAAASGAAGLFSSAALPYLFTGGSAVAGLFAQGEQAQAAEDYQTAQAQSQNEAIALNAKLTNANFQNQVLAAEMREREAQDADAIRLQKNQITAAKAKASARVAAGEAGVSGLSVEGLLRDFEQQELAYSEATRLNAGNRSRAGDNTVESLRLEAKGRISSVRPFIGSAIEQPNYIGAALRFGSSSLDIYNQQQRDKRLT